MKIKYEKHIITKLSLNDFDPDKIMCLDWCRDILSPKGYLESFVHFQVWYYNHPRNDGREYQNETTKVP